MVIRVSFVDRTTRRRLDSGGGKDLSLKECSREKLEREVCLFGHPYEFIEVDGFLCSE